MLESAGQLQGNLVRGTHNLRGVHDGNVFRLSFSAPVSSLAADNGLRNPEYAPKDIHGSVIPKDYGNKPWVYSF